MNNNTTLDRNHTRKAIEMVVHACVKCCPNCANFDHKNEVCFLNKLRPPAKIIAFGCECFEEDVIPF